MQLTAEAFQLLLVVCAVTLAASSVVGVAILAKIGLDVSRSLRPSVESRTRGIQTQADANRMLLETPSGRASLVNFFVAESNISAFFREAEERLDQVETEQQLKELLDRLRQEEKPWYSVDRLKKGAKAIGGKLFDKANDLIKPYLGGKAAGAD